MEAIGAEEVGADLAGDERRGTESIIASMIGVTRLVAPGPEVPSRRRRCRGLRVALGGVAAAGFVANEHVADAGVDEGVVRGRFAPPG